MINELNNRKANSENKYVTFMINQSEISFCSVDTITALS